MCEPNTDNILTDRIHVIMLQLPCLQAKSIDECAELYEKRYEDNRGTEESFLSIASMKR